MPESRLFMSSLSRRELARRRPGRSHAWRIVLLGAVAAAIIVAALLLGHGLYKVFHHYKRDEWERYLAAVTDWERDEYLEVLP